MGVYHLQYNSILQAAATIYEVIYLGLMIPIRTSLKKVKSSVVSQIALMKTPTRQPQQPNTMKTRRNTAHTMFILQYT